MMYEKIGDKWVNVHQIIWWELHITELRTVKVARVTYKTTDGVVFNDEFARYAKQTGDADIEFDVYNKMNGRSGG